MIKNQKGFTYIELIVAVSIFSIIAVVIGSVFVLFSKAQAQTVVKEKLLSDGRHIIETIVKTIRTSKIDFDSYQMPILNPVNDLFLLNEKNERINFNVSTQNCPTEILKCLKVENIYGNNLLSGYDVNIENLYFYIQPKIDPFKINSTGEYLSNIQPQVTIVLQISAKTNLNKEPILLNLQTTVSSKKYVR